jgi:hypothetical protein
LDTGYKTKLWLKTSFFNRFGLKIQHLEFLPAQYSRTVCPSFLELMTFSKN